LVQSTWLARLAEGKVNSAFPITSIVLVVNVMERSTIGLARAAKLSVVTAKDNNNDLDQ
jgi:hypothetical protein